jgi:hypothetical protein
MRCGEEVLTARRRETEAYAAKEQAIREAAATAIREASRVATQRARAVEQVRHRP